MSPRSLIRFYPRAWRERYGEEVLAMFGERPLSVRQSIDLIAGAIDARLSAPALQGERVVTDSTFAALKRACHTPTPKYTVRDGIIGAAIMLGSTLALVAAGIGLKRAGYGGAGDALTAIAFPVSLMLWSDYQYLRHLSWRVRALITGTSLTILLASVVVAGWL